MALALCHPQPLGPAGEPNAAPRWPNAAAWRGIGSGRDSGLRFGPSPSLPPGLVTMPHCLPPFVCGMSAHPSESLRCRRLGLSPSLADSSLPSVPQRHLRVPSPPSLTESEPLLRSPSHYRCAVPRPRRRRGRRPRREMSSLRRCRRSAAVTIRTTWMTKQLRPTQHRRPPGRARAPADQSTRPRPARLGVHGADSSRPGLPVRNPMIASICPERDR